MTIWPLRGGGGCNFGIVTSFTFDTVAAPPQLTAFQLDFPAGSVPDVLGSWQLDDQHAARVVGELPHQRRQPIEVHAVLLTCISSSGASGPGHPSMSWPTAMESA